jgi:dimethylargininase
MFTKAIVRTPCKNILNALTTANLGLPDYSLAIHQHQEYIQALKSCGLDVTVLNADENYPDSVFVEDTAVLTPQCAIISNPGAASRKGEITEMSKVLNRFYSNVEKIVAPGTLDAGDVMMVDKHFFIGLSGRTNENGANQLIAFLNRYGMTGSTINLENALHLKTGVSYLERNNLLVTGEFLNKSEFQQFNIIEINDDESYAANCVWINDKVLMPKGFSKTKRKIEELGYETILVDASEFQKANGGISCLSLRF